MKAAIALPTRAMTPDEVLAVLRVRCGNQWESASWSRETTLAQAFLPPRWMLRFGGFHAAIADIIDWLNEMFGTEIGEDQFEAALSPVTSTTLGKLADFIAAHATVPKVEPRTPKKYFDVLIAMLSHAGADTAALDPTSALEPFLRKHRKVFDWDVVKLGCGRVPAPRTEFPPWINRYFVITALIFVVAWASGFASFFLGEFGAIANDMRGRVFLSCWTVGMIAIVSILVLMGLSYFFGQAKVKIGDFATFGDLCAAMAGSSQSHSPDLPHMA